MKGIYELDILWDIANSKVLDLDKSLKTTIEKELKALEIIKKMVEIKETCGFHIVVLKGNFQRIIVEDKKEQDLLKEVLRNDD